MTYQPNMKAAKPKTIEMVEVYRGAYGNPHYQDAQGRQYDIAQFNNGLRRYKGAGDPSVHHMDGGLSPFGARFLGKVLNVEEIKEEEGDSAPSKPISGQVTVVLSAAQAALLHDAANRYLMMTDGSNEWSDTPYQRGELKELTLILGEHIDALQALAKGVA